MTAPERSSAPPTSTVDPEEAVPASALSERSQPARLEHFAAAGAQLREQLARLELERLMNALNECGGNQSRAAVRLGMSRRSLVYRLTALGLTRPRKRA